MTELAPPLSQRAAPFDQGRGTALFAAPLLLWLIERMAPRRLLTVGAGCEELHLTICAAIEDQALNAVCFHLAHDASVSFRAAQARHDRQRSRFLLFDGAAPRLGAKGRFDLIIRRENSAFSPGAVAVWRGGLTDGGALVLHGTGGAPALSPENGVVWAIGEQTLALIGAAAAEAQGLVDLTQDLQNETYLTLAGRLAAGVAADALAAGRAARQQAENALRAAEDTHRREIMTMARKLAEMTERSAEQRLAAQESATRIAQLEARLSAARGGGARAWANPFARLAGKGPH